MSRRTLSPWVHDGRVTTAIESLQVAEFADTLIVAERFRMVERR
jgi:hypothetical protein